MTSILIAEDDPSVREMMDVVLTQAGYRVSTVSDGESALDIIKRSRFSAILLDIHMPRMSGLEVLKVVQRSHRSVPVIMVTANSAKATVHEAVQLGCSGYLVKPFTPAALVDRVRKAIAPPAQAVQEFVDLD